MGQQRVNWWEHRATVAILMFIAIIPLLWPTVPPLVDLPGHMGRFRVELEGAGSPLAQFYNFRWALIGNLGVDLLIVPAAKLFGLELGVKLIVMAIPAMTVAGMLLIAREIHGRIPPTTLFALPLAYSHPFQFGFVNFALAMALALLSFALWVHLTKIARLRMRAAVFLMISPLIWLTHIYGLGLLGVLVFSAELCRYRDAGLGWLSAVVNSVSSCLVLALPIVAMPFFHDLTGAAGSQGWFNWSNKFDFVRGILHDRWYSFDLLSITVLLALVPFAALSRKLTFSRPLLIASAILLVVYIAMPTTLLHSTYADMRLAPFVLMIGLLAIRPTSLASPRFLTGLAIVGLLFFGIRITASAANFAIISARQDRALAALDHVPTGSRLISFTGQAWPYRLEHLAGMAIVRRRAFSNDQWNWQGMNLMSVVKSDAPGFTADPSQTVIANDKRGDGSRLRIDVALAQFPRPAFDYLWLINPPKYDARLIASMTEIWRDGDDVLFRIGHH